MNLNQKIILWLILFILALMILASIEAFTMKTHSINVNCYDKYNSKINGLTCTKELNCGIMSNILGLCN